MSRWTTALLVAAVGAAGWWASQRTSAAKPDSRPVAQSSTGSIDPKMVRTPPNVDPKMVRTLPNVDPKMVRVPSAPHSPEDSAPPSSEAR